MSVKTYNFFNKNFYYTHSLMAEEQQPNSTDVELPEYNQQFQKIKFNQELNQWEIEDILLKGEYFRKSDNLFFTEIKLKEQDLYVDFKKLKEEKIKEIKNLYHQSQIVILIDGCTIPVLLKGDFYLLLKDRVSTSEKYGFASVEFVDINKNSYQAGANRSTKELPFIFLNELFTILNPYSENNRLICSEYIGDEDTGLEGKAQYCQTSEGLNNLNPLFAKCPNVDLDLLADNLYSKTDEQLKVLNDKYGNKNIALFRQWKDSLVVNEQGKYIMFEKIN